MTFPSTLVKRLRFVINKSLSFSSKPRSSRRYPASVITSQALSASFVARSNASVSSATFSTTSGVPSFLKFVSRFCSPSKRKTRCAKLCRSESSERWTWHSSVRFRIWYKQTSLWGLPIVPLTERKCSQRHSNTELWTDSQEIVFLLMTIPMRDDLFQKHTSVGIEWMWTSIRWMWTSLANCSSWLPSNLSQKITRLIEKLPGALG